MTSCREVSSWIDTFADGELPIERAVDTESHIAHCPNCAERLRFERAFRVSLKHSVRSDAVPTQSLRERLERAMATEREQARVYACTPMSGGNQAVVARMRESSSRKRALAQVRRTVAAAQTTTAPSDVATWNWGPLSWRSLLPVAAAAAGAILWAGVQNNTQPAVARGDAADVRLSELERMLQMMVTRHEAGSAQARAVPFAPAAEKLEPPFQLPPLQDVRQESHFPAPVLAVNDSLTALRGASSVYQVKGHRVTFFAYEAGMAPLRARLTPGQAKGHVVFVGKRQGYSVVTVEDGPVGYAMTSDLPVAESADLIASAIDARVPH